MRCIWQGSVFEDIFSVASPKLYFLVKRFLLASYMIYLGFYHTTWYGIRELFSYTNVQEAIACGWWKSLYFATHGLSWFGRLCSETYTVKKRGKGLSVSTVQIRHQAKIFYKKKLRTLLEIQCSYGFTFF